MMAMGWVTSSLAHFQDARKRDNWQSDHPTTANCTIMARAVCKEIRVSASPLHPCHDPKANPAHIPPTQLPRTTTFAALQTPGTRGAWSR